jgi:hypothetical protein
LAVARWNTQIWFASVVALVTLLLAFIEIGIYLAHAPPRVNPSLTTVELWQYVLQGSALAVAGFLVLARRRARVLGWILLGGALPLMAAACLSTWLRFTTANTPVVITSARYSALPCCV